jgi:alcohol-forming fatty acyl-CoA reductase
MIKFVEQINEKFEKSLETVKADIIHPWPNTYSYSKALTEDVVRQFGDVIPAAVVRPSIVISTISGKNFYFQALFSKFYLSVIFFYSDPLEGWSDNIYGVNGVLIGVALGLIRAMMGDLKKKADLIPADIVIDAILAAAHRISEDTKVEKAITMIPKTKIYNCVSNTENPITWSKFIIV